MTERYYKRDYEEKYYIFDSETITEQEFDEKYEINGYKAFEDSLTGDEITLALNHYHKQQQESNILIHEGVQLAIENTRLKKQLEYFKK